MNESVEVTEFNCVVCQKNGIRRISAYNNLPRVTSDCKPWPPGGKIGICEHCGTIQKIPDTRWQEEVQKIYDAYEIYHLSEGTEQLIFLPEGSSVPRSQALVNFIVSQSSLPSGEGQLLDIGCGNGSAISNFSRTLPEWSFDGSELSEKFLPVLRSIERFRKLHTDPLATVSDRYDLVSMIHSLEHIPDPYSALKTAAKLTKTDGKIFIEVPDIESSPFDLLVADHLTHFSCETLGALASRCSVQIDIIKNTVLPKEITLLGHRASVKETLPDPSHGLRICEETVAWLEQVLTTAKNAAMESSQFGIFGSSISGIWLYGALRKKVHFFVDEDASKIGGSFEGVPIVSPDQVPIGATIFVPLVPSVAANIIRRLSHLSANLIPPPPFR